MSSLILSDDINSNPFIYFHGTSSCFEKQIDKEGILNNNSERFKLVYEGYQLYRKICFCLIDGYNETNIYNGFNEAVFKLQYAYADLLNGVKGDTFLTFFDSQAMSYTERIGGEFYSGLIHLSNELEQIVNDYEKFNHKRKELYKEARKRWENRYEGKFNDWTPYKPIHKEFLVQKYNLFKKFQNDYNYLLNEHKYGIIYVCRFDVRKLLNSKDVQALSISVDGVEPHEIIDKIIVTKKMQEEYNYGSYPLGITKLKRLRKIREIGKNTLDELHKHMAKSFELIDGFQLE